MKAKYIAWSVTLAVIAVVFAVFFWLWGLTSSIG